MAASSSEGSMLENASYANRNTSPTALHDPTHTMPENPTMLSNGMPTARRAGEEAAPAEQHDPHVGAQERRRDRGHGGQGEDRAAPGERVAGMDEGEGNRDRHGQRHHGDAQHHAVAEGRHVALAAEEGGEVGQGRGAVGRGQAGAQQPELGRTTSASRSALTANAAASQGSRAGSWRRDPARPRARGARPRTASGCRRAGW